MQIRERLKIENEDLTSKISNESLVENQIIINRFLDQQDLCRTCPGIKKCEYDGILSFLVLDSFNGKEELRYLQRGFCDQRIRNVELLKQEKALKSSKLPAGLIKMTLDNFVSSIESQPVVAAAKQVVEGSIYPGLFIHGEPGRGKTHLAVAMMHEFMSAGIPCIYVTTVDLMQKLRDSVKEKKTTELLDRIQESPFLVLDDLGAEKPNDWVIEKLFHILDHRSKIARSKNYPEGVVTVITSNYDLNDLAKRMALEGEPASGTRIISRISGMCIPAPLKGIDWRVKSRG